MPFSDVVPAGHWETGLPCQSEGMSSPNDMGSDASLWYPGFPRLGIFISPDPIGVPDTQSDFGATFQSLGFSKKSAGILEFDLVKNTAEHRAVGQILADGLGAKGHKL